MRESLEMQLLEIYENYKKESKNYMQWLEELVDQDFEGYTAEEISSKLEQARKQFEAFMEASGEIEVEEDQKANYQDLRYLVMDTLFLAADLVHFYKCGEQGRFKMRALNYFNKRRRADMFGNPNGGGNCPIM